MIWNVIDRRTRPYRWKCVNAIVEAIEHDNSCNDADLADEAPPSLLIDHDKRDGISLREAIEWANQQRCPVTLYIYDADGATRATHLRAAGQRFTAMSDQRYYLCEFRLDGRQLHVIWYTDAEDGLVRMQDGRIASFADEAQARDFCRDARISLMSDPPVIYDFDAIAMWCGNPTAATIDPVAFLNAWNMLDDADRFKSGPDSLYRVSSRKATDVYSKLIFANNLPALTPIGARYEPIWSQDESKLFSRIFSLGLTGLRASLHDIDR
jgi:hypothetical protein